MEKYDKIEDIGKGSFGTVAKIKRKSDGRYLVWKELNYGKMSEKEKQMLVSEVNILRDLRHTNIVINLLTTILIPINERDFPPRCTLLFFWVHKLDI